MEIPNADRYNFIEKKANEKKANVDFLDGNLKVSFSIDPEAAEHLPEISDEELRTGQEKYHVLFEQLGCTLAYREGNERWCLCFSSFAALKFGGINPED